MDVRTEKPGKHNDPGMAQSMSVETPVEDDNKVTETEYMTEYGTAFSEQQGYIQEIAGHLFDAVRTSWWCADQETRARVTAILPRLVKGFASRLRYDTDYLIHQDIVTFIDEHSRNIATEFLNMESIQSKSDVDKPWRFVFNTRASGWLRTQLRREFCLASTRPNIIQEIQDTIMSTFPPAPEYSEDSSRQYYAVTFELECDLLFFFETQSPEQSGEGFGTAFTLTGSELNVQGATCRNYMRQTWPVTGEAIIELVTGALCVQQGCAFMKTMLDGTELSAMISECNGKLIVEAYGAAVSIAEIGEQLAWLGAAVGTLPREHNKIMYCTPVITEDRESDNITSPRSILQPSLESINLKIMFEMEETSATAQHGGCIIVNGYPISQRNVWRESGSFGQCGGTIGTESWNRSIERLCMREWLFHQGFSMRET